MNVAVAVDQGPLIFKTPRMENSYLRDTRELRIRLPGLWRPNPDELTSRYPWMESVKDDDDVSPQESVTLILATPLMPEDVGVIDGGEYQRRIKECNPILLGFQHCQWFVTYGVNHPQIADLPDGLWIDFPGIRAKSISGHYRIPQVSKNDGRWDQRWVWLSSGFRSNGRVAIDAPPSLQ
jgi:hypothetical protein